MNRIAILRAGALGDFILTLPALAALRRAYPRATLTVIGPLPAATLAAHPCYADEIVPFDDVRLAPLFAELDSPTEWIQRTLGPCDVVVIWSYDRTGHLQRNLAMLGIPHILRADPFPPDGAPCHVAQHLLQSLVPLGIDPHLLPGVPLALHESDRREAGSFLKRHGLDDSGGDTRLIAIHPGAGSPRKRWSAARFAALTRDLAGMFAARPLVIAGPADDYAVSEMLSHCPRDSTVLTEGLPLRTLAAVLRRCQLYVGNDSGISHVAGIAGTPTVVLFGPTDPARWHPIGPHIVALKASDRDLTAISMDDVRESCLEMVRGRGKGRIGE